MPDDGEKPARTVRVVPFRIDPCAVTNERFAAFVAATALAMSFKPSGHGLYNFAVTSVMLGYATPAAS